MLKVLRRGSTRYLALSAILLTVLLCLYYANYNATPTGNATVVTSSASASDVAKVSAEQRKDEDAPAVPGDHGLLAAEEHVPEADFLEPEPDSLITQDTCPVLHSSKTDVDTVEQFKKFEFQVRRNPCQMN
jgi:hypothetical protein